MRAGSWRPSRQTAEQVGGIACRVDTQANSAPLHGVTFAGDQVLQRNDLTTIVVCSDLDIPKRKPELMYIARERNRDSDGIGAIDRFLDEADHVAVID